MESVEVPRGCYFRFVSRNVSRIDEICIGDYLEKRLNVPVVDSEEEWRTSVRDFL
jgi:hypothetical protein